MGGHCTFVAKLLEMGADPNAIVRYGSPLKAACYTGKDNTIELLITKGAVISSEECNALEAAASRGHFSTLKLLVEHFFPTEAQDSEDESRNQRTSLVKYALFAASRGNHCDTCLRMVQKDMPLKRSNTRWKCTTMKLPVYYLVTFKR